MRVEWPVLFNSYALGQTRLWDAWSVRDDKSHSTIVPSTLIEISNCLKSWLVSDESARESWRSNEIERLRSHQLSSSPVLVWSRLRAWFSRAAQDSRRNWKIVSRSKRQKQRRKDAKTRMKIVYLLPLVTAFAWPALLMITEHNANVSVFLTQCAHVLCHIYVPGLGGLF